MQELIEVIQVTKQFGGVTALDQVDLTLKPKEIVGLIGPNGSGKTTLLNVISGVNPPTKGVICVDGVNIVGWPSDKIARLKIARTFQHIRLFHNLTVLENVEVGATLQRKTPNTMSLREYAITAIEEVGLQSDLYRDASTLDYGAQRKLEIARALVTRPRYLFLDEPAAGMNEAETDELLKNLKYILDTHGMGILIIDHDISLIMRICNRITVLNEGRVICEGPPIKIQTDLAVAEAYLGRIDKNNQYEN